MKFGYARVSTRGQNLEAQRDALTAAGCDKINTEKASGNGSKERTELDRLVENLRKGDVLVVYKLDRQGRSTFKLLGLTEDLQQRGVEFASLKDHIDTSSAIGKAMFRMRAVLAEMERKLIVERTQTGLQAARKRGRVGGRLRNVIMKLSFNMKQVNLDLKYAYGEVFKGLV